MIQELFSHGYQRAEGFGVDRGRHGAEQWKGSLREWTKNPGRGASAAEDRIAWKQRAYSPIHH